VIYQRRNAKLTKILTGWVAFVNLVIGYCLRDAYSIEYDVRKENVTHWHWFNGESKLKKKSGVDRVVLQLFPVWEGPRTRASDVPPDAKPVWSDRLMSI
jgi:hypothetical protein